MSDEDSIGQLLMYIDNTIQYGEDLDVKIPKVRKVWGQKKFFFEKC